MKADESAAQHAQQAFIAELRHWREVGGYSQKALATAVGYTPSYVSKVETGSVVPSRGFSESADQRLRAGRALVRRWKGLNDALNEATGDSRSTHTTGPVPDDPQSAPSAALCVEHEHAELTYLDGVFRTRVRRQLQNTVPIQQGALPEVLI